MKDFNIDVMPIEDSLKALEEQGKTATILTIIPPFPPFSKGGVGVQPKHR